MTSQGDNKFVHQPKRRPSLRQIAKSAGVSHTAVARALRDDPLLSAELRQRVHEIARRIGYLPSDVAQGLMSGWSGTLGLILPRLASMFVSDVAEGVANAMWHDGAIPLVLCSNHDIDREEKMLDALARKRVSGVIIMPCSEDRDESHFMHLLSQHTPIVTVDTAIPQIDSPLVATDNELGGMIATQHLIDQGHRHIVHLGAPIDNDQYERGRERGYRDAMEKAGLEPHVITTRSRRFGLEDIIPEVRTFFDSAEGRKTTAVFTFSDALAFCVYEYAAEIGLTIGKDLAVVGFGNMYAFPRGLPHAVNVFTPKLTTVEQFPIRIGQVAVEVMRKMMGGKAVSRRTLIKPELRIGASSLNVRTERQPSGS